MAQETIDYHVSPLQMMRLVTPPEPETPRHLELEPVVVVAATVVLRNLETLRAAKSK
jgi:hypothetical protein